MRWLISEDVCEVTADKILRVGQLSLCCIQGIDENEVLSARERCKPTILPARPCTSASKYQRPGSPGMRLDCSIKTASAKWGEPALLKRMGVRHGEWVIAR